MNYKTLLILAAALYSLSAGAQESSVYTLARCRALALEQNKKLKAADYDIRAAQAAQRSVAASAYPALDGSVMGIHLGEPLGGALNGMIPKFMLNGSLSATLPVYAGGKIQNGKAAAAKGVEISREQKSMTEAEVLLQTEKAYWQIVLVQEKIVLAGKYQAMLESLEKDLQNAFDAGLTYKNDLLRVQVSLNEAKLNRSRAEDGLVMAKLSLAQIIGMADSADFSVSDMLPGGFESITTNGESQAERRPELRLLHRAIEAEELQKKILQGDRLPTIGLSLNGSTALGKNANIKDGSDHMSFYYGIASVSIPIFDWGKRSNKVKEQSFRIASRQAQLEDTRKLIGLEIRGAALQLNQSARKIGSSELSLKQATENLRLAEDRLAAGTIVGKDVLEAQAIWQEAFSSTIDARIEYKINEAVYKKATGALLP